MFVWGRNNNHLFRHNHKKTYSLPQKLPINRSVIKCAAGYDYIMILTSSPGMLLCYYQSAIYQLSAFSNVVDVQTTDNMIVVVRSDGSASISEFNPEKIIANELSCNTISLNEPICRIFMNYGDIFMRTASNKIYHLKRNQWYETKNYSDPIQVEGLQGRIIKTICPALNYNYFLSQDGVIYLSTKGEPSKAFALKTQERYINIAAADYFLGIAQNGRLYILGTYLENNYQTPTQFGKISQRFKKVYLSGQNGFAITENGEGWIWGKNANGQLGISDYQPRTKPFPLITMQKHNIEQLFIGEGYTICLVSLAQCSKYKNNSIATSFNDFSRAYQSVKSVKCDIQIFPSVTVSNTTKNSKSKDKIKPAKTQNLRDNTKSIIQNKTPAKQSQRSKSPGLINRSTSKSPVQHYTKSPYLQHLRDNKSKSNCKSKKQTSIISRQNELQAQIEQLSNQNSKLKQVLHIKQAIIEDITDKIRLLEDAIDEHQRSLTSRDHLMDEYQKREKQYRIHIDELEKEIETLINGKSMTSQHKGGEYYDEMYKKLKVEFTDVKDYYMNKMKEYQDLLNNERTHYKDKIRSLQEEINTQRTVKQEEQENTSKPYAHHQECKLNSQESRKNTTLLNRNNKQNMQKQSKSKISEQNVQKMELIISRIEDSKVRIGKSATKLNALFEQ